MDLSSDGILIGFVHKVTLIKGTKESCCLVAQNDQKVLGSQTGLYRLFVNEVAVGSECESRRSESSEPSSLYW